MGSQLQHHWWDPGYVNGIYHESLEFHLCGELGNLSFLLSSAVNQEHSYQSYGIIKKWKLNMQIYLNPHIRVSGIQ